MKRYTPHILIPLEGTQMHQLTRLAICLLKPRMKQNSLPWPYRKQHSFRNLKSGKHFSFLYAASIPDNSLLPYSDVFEKPLRKRKSIFVFCPGFMVREDLSTTRIGLVDCHVTVIEPGWIRKTRNGPHCWTRGAEILSFLHTYKATILKSVEP